MGGVVQRRQCAATLSLLSAAYIERTIECAILASSATLGTFKGIGPVSESPLWANESVCTGTFDVHRRQDAGVSESFGGGICVGRQEGQDTDCVDSSHFLLPTLQ